MPAEYINTTTLDASNDVVGGPIPLFLDSPRSVSFTQVWTSTLEATTTIEGTNDPTVYTDMQNGTDTAAWEDISSQVTTLESPAGTAGNSSCNFSFAGYAWVRLKCARTASSGDYTVYMSFN